MTTALAPITATILGWTELITSEWLAINLAYLALTIASRVAGVVRKRALLGAASVLFVVFGVIVGLWSMVVWNVVLGVLNIEKAFRDSRRERPEGQPVGPQQSESREFAAPQPTERSTRVLICDVGLEQSRARDRGYASVLDQVQVDPSVRVSLTFLAIGATESVRAHVRVPTECETELVLIDDGSIKSRDSLSTARVLARMIGDLESYGRFDLVVFVGAENGNFPFTTAIRTAYELGLRVLMNARSVHVEASGLSITRSSEHVESSAAIEEPAVVGLVPAAMPEHIIHSSAASNPGSPRRLEPV